MRLPRPGELFERKYRIERELGAGGFSTVYLARDELAGRYVALKVLFPDDEPGYAAETRARFEREVSILARIDHPHVVRMHECGESVGGLLYVVFEYVPGEDLSDLLDRRGRLDPDTVRTVLTQLLGALQEAHKAGLVHRDIKPENIRVCSPPGEPIEVCLLDFGIARATDSGSPSLTKTGNLIGTPRYMSPEQLLERPLTPASDIYSLGVVGFELLVGRDALPGNRFNDQFDRLMTGHVFSTELIDVIGPALWSVIERMTAQNPADRLPTAPAVLGALEHGVERTTIARQHADQAEEQRAQPVPILAALVGTAVLILGAALIFSNDSPEPAYKPPSLTPATALLRTPDLGATEPVAPPPPAAPAIDVGVAVEPDLPPPVAGGCEVERPTLPESIEMFVGKNHDFRKPTALIIWVYSHNQQDPTVTVRDEDFRRLVDEENVIIAVPRAPHPTPLSSWNATDQVHIEEVKDAIVAQYCVDLEQVYVWSSAGGGVLTTRLACLPWPSGVAIATYVESETHRFDCPDPRPLLWIAGRDSLHQPINGGADCLFHRRRRFSESVRAASERRGCESQTRSTLDEDHTQCERYVGCDVPFEVCRTGGGLGWPGTPQPLAARRNTEICAEPPPEPNFNAARHAWDFFQSIREKP